jgi:D-arabinose 1-dehydrogenase-like Zn-dependent alcohol dehydrogenase
LTWEIVASTGFEAQILFVFVDFVHDQGADIAFVGLSPKDTMPPMPITAFVVLGLTFHAVYVGQRKTLESLLQLIDSGKVRHNFVRMGGLYFVICR